MTDFLRDRIKWDLPSVDILWSLFCSALFSFRHDSLLRPFPPMFLNKGAEIEEKDFDSLKETVDSLPSMKDLCDEEAFFNVNSSSLNLLSWLLENFGSDIVSVDKKTAYGTIKQLAGESFITTSEPSYIFEIIPSPNAASRFEAARGDRKLLYGYHGSRLENFYSILQNGLQYHLNKNSLYGQGIYLSSELSMCFLYSPTGSGWQKSVLGATLSCVAVCEFIDHPDVKCQTIDTAEGKNRARARDSQAGDIPEKYYLVLNSSLVRVKYVLVYSNNKGAEPNAREILANKPWYFRYKSVVVLGTYALVLCAVGLMNSRSFTLFLRRLLS